jgi:molybdate transport system permease protein
MIDWMPFWLSLKLAAMTTAVLFVICLPLAYWLVYGRGSWISFVEVLVSLPLVLPPSVIGFYLLLAFNPSHGFGAWLDRHFDIRLAFSFGGLVLGSIIYSLPFMANALKSGFASLAPGLKEASYSLGKSPARTLFKVLLPNMKSSVLTGMVLTFAHTLGEFGVILMIGGNIPGKTRLASIAIYEEVEMMNYHDANRYALILLVASFLLLLGVYRINHRFFRFARP